MSTSGSDDLSEFSVATAPSTPLHRALALCVVAAMLAAYLAVILFAPTPPQRIDGFVPATYAIIMVADLVAAVLLFALFSATGARSLLVLASGYLFSSLMVAAQQLTTPGVFSPTGLLGAEPQTTSWLYFLWRFGFSASILVYAALQLGTPHAAAGSRKRRFSVAVAVAIVFAAACAMIFATTAGHDLFPAVLSDGKALPLGRYINSGIMLVDLVALILLVRAGARSILDVWLVVVAFALLAECTMMMFFVDGRYTFSFYAVRLIGLPVSKVVLIVLLWESMRLYANLATSHRELQRERASRLTNAATLMAAIAHEVRQPLAGINLLAYAGQQSLERTAPDVRASGRLFGEIKHAAARANEVFDNFLRLTRGVKRELQATDVNAMAVEATGLLKKNLDERNVTTVMQLAPGLPTVQCHTGQLREVLLNLIQNAIDAMAATTAAPRVLTITTSRRGPGSIVISLRDTGPGIDPDYLTTIFDPFVTTKAKGTGLGLAVCKMIVDQHGGKLTASTGRNGGARFEVTLPTRPAPSTALDLPDEHIATVQAAG